MKTLYLIFTASFLLTYSNYSLSQCIADAGPDIHRCSRDSSVQLGGDPTAFGGTPPYTYKWSIDPIPTLSQVVPYVYASNMINDTSIANPIFTYNGSFLKDSISIYLKITDNQGCHSFDTLKLTTSLFGIHLSYHNIYINEGDSVYLNQTPNIGGGFGSSAYDWNPSYGLSDTNLASGFWASPSTTTFYTATVTDSKGCSKTGGSFYHIYVNTVGLNDNALKEVELFPNPSSDMIYINKEKSETISKIEIFTLSGRIINTLTNPKTQIDISNYPNGVYTLKIYFDDYVSSQKIVKK
jgi:hypothetical protein